MTEELSLPSMSHLVSRGLVEVYTGDGKGKTSAALGVVLRALGHGLRVYIVFFMKGDSPDGERGMLSRLGNVTVASFGSNRFIDPAYLRPEDVEQARQALAAAREATLSGKYDLVVLDEVNLAAAWKLVGVEDVLRLIDDRPAGVELILTGRQAPTELMRRADLVTEMLKIKHPYDTGVQARRGIDY